MRIPATPARMKTALLLTFETLKTKLVFDVN